ncbi:AMP-dependent synthetase [Hoeflea sp. BAL378]|uniref:class I adenylate-forming enzyme family protein n=1 Tax=Hoeflea sp. BAL378 TaxID=1547437 RepID=UPI00051456CE|nr:AMP-binding protein [Hoeflea sp. BAL378]KGF70471.1 AMP-dependent synthetase [Hoeflea sp. BAL378]
MNIANWLHASSRAYPDRPAIRFGDQLHATYGQFAARAATMARRLAAHHDVCPGDRVAIFAANCPEYLELLYAIWWAGAVAVPINHKLHPREAGWIVANAGARLIFTQTGSDLAQDGLLQRCTEIGIGSPQHAQLVVDVETSAADLIAPVPREADDIAWLFYTSGTTGRPKGVMLTHRNLTAMSLTYALDVDQVSGDDHPLCAAPMSHGAGLYNFPYIRRGACHIVPRSRAFDPREIIDLAGRLGNLTFFAAPTMVKRLVDASGETGFEGDGIKSIIYGGGPMYAGDLDAALEQLGTRFVQIYGQGESPMTITVLPRDLVSDTSHGNWRSRRNSVGLAQAGVRLRVVDAQFRACPHGETGEIMVSGDTVMKGYWRNPEATRETLVDGWLRTGDLGYLDADGFLTLTDRAKDVIISGGTNIYPREVEEVLLLHESVAEAAVVGAPDPEWGEAVVAFVVLKGGAGGDPQGLETWCRSQMASFKKPKRYVFVSDLPKNNYGKVVKTTLREIAARDASPGSQG